MSWQYDSNKSTRDSAGNRLAKLNIAAFEHSSQARLDSLAFTPKGHRKEHKPPLARIQSEFVLLRRGRYPRITRALHITTLGVVVVMLVIGAYAYTPNWIQTDLSAYLEGDSEANLVVDDGVESDTIVELPVTNFDSLGQSCKPQLLLDESSGVTCGGCRKDLFFGSYVECDGTHPDATFSGCSWMGGPNCKFEPQREVSGPECAASCLAERGCRFFTYHYRRKTCELHLMKRCHKSQFSAAGTVYYIPPPCRKHKVTQSREQVVLKPQTTTGSKELETQHDKTKIKNCTAVLLSTPLQGLTCRGCHKDVTAGRFLFCNSRASPKETMNLRINKGSSTLTTSINHQGGIQSHKNDCDSWDGSGNCEFTPEVVLSRSRCEELCRSEPEGCNFFLHGHGDKNASKPHTCRLFLTKSCTVDFAQRVPLNHNASLYEIGLQVPVEHACPTEHPHIHDPTEVDPTMAAKVAIAARDQRLRLLAASRAGTTKRAAKAPVSSAEAAHTRGDSDTESDDTFRRLTAKESGLQVDSGYTSSGTSSDSSSNKDVGRKREPSGYAQRLLRGMKSSDEKGFSPNPATWDPVEHGWRERRAQTKLKRDSDLD
jgi:hypothetical protein